MNYLAILIAAIVGWLAGAGWYMALSKPWMAAQGWQRKEDTPRMEGFASAAPFIISFVAELIMAWILAGAIGHLGPGQATIRNGIISGAILWFGFVATTITVNNAFSGRKPMLTIIDAGHWLLVLVLMGAVIGAFGS